MDNMVEVKKDALRQTQSGEWKATFTLLPSDMPPELLQAPMGSRYYVVFVDADAYDEREGRVKPEPEQSEGEKLRTRAVLLCRDKIFQEYASYCINIPDAVASKTEHTAKGFLCYTCGIISRSELATDQEAQIRFRELLNNFYQWKLENQYSDNLER